MRILHIFDHSVPLHSGYSFRSLSILRQQRARGWETFQLTSPKHILDSPPVEFVDGFEFYRTPPVTGFSARIPILRELAQMRATTKRLESVARLVRPDVLHAHSPVLNAIPALRVGRRLGIPVVYEVRAFWEDAATDHGTSKEGSLRYRATRALESFALRHADAVTTICEGLRGDIVKRGIAEDIVTVIPNAVDIESFSDSPPHDDDLAAKLGLTGKTVLGFIGSFYAYEGLHLLIEALPKILAKSPDVRVLLVGGGPQEPRLKALSHEKGVADKVIFAGRVPHSTVGQYYGLIDVLVYPRISIRLTELVTPLKPLEAMAQRKMLIASDIGGHRELIRHRETGILFKADNADSLAEAALWTLENRDKWPDQLERARHFVEEERSWARSVANYERVYGGIAA
jgi:PEP-CTERM/exosortase A-associated glycosyltransferase